MGYKRQTKTFRLTWPEGEDLAGLEVTIAGLSTGEFLELADLTDNVSDTTDPSIEDTRKLLAMLAGSLKDWNLEDEGGKPVPATIEGVMSNEFTFNLDVIVAWMEAVGGALSGPLGQPSISGSPALEASLPMEPLSESRAS